MLTEASDAERKAGSNVIERKDPFSQSKRYRRVQT
jgi:hypothetical protein